MDSEWVRKGFCKQCGRCCNLNNWNVNENIIENPQVSFNEDGNCVYLKDGLCSIHHNNKPSICMAFPESSRNFYNFLCVNECGFYFVRKNHNT